MALNLQESGDKPHQVFGFAGNPTRELFKKRIDNIRDSGTLIEKGAWKKPLRHLLISCRNL